VPIAALAIVADLVESIIKRRATIKDSGATIPGIGGIFDVADSLILTAPAGYVVFSLL
jgi:phosphatidate cytidylyltransferase